VLTPGYDTHAGVYAVGVLMTRFKEFARIRAAIKHKNEPELQWAFEYCQMRLRIATRKDHAKYWRGVQREVTDVIRSLAAPAT
jgi:hypothetical protein